MVPVVCRLTRDGGASSISSSSSSSVGCSFTASFVASAFATCNASARLRDADGRRRCEYAWILTALSNEVPLLLLLLLLLWRLLLLLWLLSRIDVASVHDGLLKSTNRLGRLLERVRRRVPLLVRVLVRGLVVVAPVVCEDRRLIVLMSFVILSFVLSCPVLPCPANSYCYC